MSALAELRGQGFKVSASGDGRIALSPGPSLTPDLISYARLHKPEILADLAEEEVEVAAGLRCPRCRQLDYRPLGGGRRRCLRCPTTFGASGVDQEVEA